MKLLLALIITLIIILPAEKSIRKHPAVWYCFAFVLSLLGVMLPASAPDWLERIINGYISRGTLATAIFILVMYARILPPKSRPFRVLMGLRAPLAIMASFMILIHNGTYFIQYYNNISQRNMSMTLPERIASCCTVLMLLLLIPLTITSFTVVRKKMKGKNWKRLQRFSYLFYGLIYLHVACLFGLQIARGNRAYQLELAIYTAIFGFYLISRVALYLKNTKKITAEKYLRNVGIPVVFACSAFILLFQVPQDKNSVTSKDEAASSTQTEASAESAAPTETTETATATNTAAPIYQDGEWIGSALGYNDNITVSVTITNGTIANITILESSDDEPYYSWAKDEIPQSILAAQSTEVDTVSGATFSSEGIIDAVDNALQQAQVNP